MDGLSVDRLTRLGRVTSVVPSPAGDWLAVAVQRLSKDEARYVSDLWRVPLAGGPPVQLTRGDSDDRAPCFRRDGSLGFLSDRDATGDAAPKDDDRRSQVWLFPVGGGEPRPVTDEPLGVTELRFASHGDRMVVIAPVLPGIPHGEQRDRQRDRKKHGPSALHYRSAPVRFWDRWIEPAAPHVIAYDEEGEGRCDLTPDADRDHRDVQWDLSADGSLVVIGQKQMGEDRIWDQALRVIDIRTGDHRDLAVRSRVALEMPRFSPDGRLIAAKLEERYPARCPTVRLVVVDVATGEVKDVAPRWDRWSTPEAWTADGAALLVTADDGGTVPLFRVDVASGEVTRITAEEDGGSHAGVRLLPGSDAAVGVRSRFHHPPEPFRVALRPGAHPELCAVLSAFPEAEGKEIATWESLRTQSDDGAAVQWFLVKPAAAKGPVPVLFWIHGGPIAEWGDGWHWRWNPLLAASAGYAVALPNPRGSTGFGQSFIDGIWGNTWGDQCYRDLMAVADAIALMPGVDAKRMGAMGGSFGGYMVNWIGGQTDRFACIVSHASLFDLSAFYGVTDAPGWFGLELGGNPHKDAEAFDRFSPHRFVARWKTPALVIHGERDYRVPIGEALALFEALQLHGVESELLVFPDENHWILKPRNIRIWYRTVLGFLDSYLGGTEG